MFIKSGFPSTHFFQLPVKNHGTVLFFLKVLEGMKVSIADCISDLKVVQICSIESFIFIMFWIFRDSLSQAEKISSQLALENRYTFRGFCLL